MHAKCLMFISRNFFVECCLFITQYICLFPGGRTADAIVSTALSKASSMVNARLKGKSSGGRSGGGSKVS